MTPWDSERVLGAIAELDDEALSEEFIDVRTEDYRLLRYPERFLSPTLPAAQIVATHTQRPLEKLFEEVAATVRSWGVDAVHWWVNASTRPANLEDWLRARGAVVSDAFDVLACELERDLDVPSAEGVRVAPVDSAQSLKDAASVESRGLGRAESDTAELDERLRETLDDVAASRVFQFVVYVDEAPAATGLCRVNGEVGRLYGAVTLPEYRHRGCYRAILAARMRSAREAGAKVVITRARPQTSGRILRQAGFAVHGTETCYRVALD